MTDVFGTNNLEAGGYLKDGKAEMKSKKETSKLIAFFARANYNYDGKYMASASIRREGSTKFGANNKWAWFPSVSAGWMISREDFMESQEVFDVLKFRAGFGITVSRYLRYRRWSLERLHRFMANRHLRSEYQPESRFEMGEE